MSRNPRRRNPAGILLSLLFIAAAAFAVHSCMKTAAPETGEKEPEVQTDTPTQSSSQEDSAHFRRKDNFYTILVCGVDDGNGGSDTNLLLAVDAENHSLYGVSIPRDTKAEYGGKSHKINSAYNVGGTELLSEIVSDQLGVPIDHTMTIDLEGFVSIIDALGGVDFDVPIDMDYDDPLQGLSIHLKAGMQHLDGRQAMGVVRFRHNNDGTGYGSEDIGRMQTQQAFLKAVLSQALSITGLTRVGELAKIMGSAVDTDLSVPNLAWFGVQAISAGTDSIDFSTLPGDWKSPYIYLDQEEVLAVVNEHLNPYTEDRTPDDLNIPS